jgi:hypothetical protein
MFVKNLTLFLFSLCFLVGCGRQPDIRTYTEVVQMPESATQPPPSQMQEMPSIPEMLRAAPLNVEPVPENMPADHPTLTGQIPAGQFPTRDIEMHGPGDGHNHPFPPQGAAPMMSAAPAADPNAMVGRESEVPPPPEAGDLTWDLPPGWSARAGGGLRVAEFIPNDVPEGNVVTLIALGGPGGNVQANISRWRGQVGLPPAGESNVQTIEGKLPFTFMTLVEESRAASLPTTTIAAIYQLDGRSVFLKFMGPTDIVAAHKLDFLQLAGSLRIEGDS